MVCLGYRPPNKDNTIEKEEIMKRRVLHINNRIAGSSLKNTNKKIKFLILDDISKLEVNMKDSSLK